VIGKGPENARTSRPVRHRRFGEHRGVVLAYMRRRRVVGWDMRPIIHVGPPHVKRIVTGS
jgi:hypothetical protein